MAQKSRYTELSRCMTRFVRGQVTVSDLSLTLIQIEKFSVGGKLQHPFWALTGLYSAFRRKQPRLKTAVELSCNKRDLGVSGMRCTGTMVVTLGQAKGSWLHETRQNPLVV